MRVRQKAKFFSELSLLLPKKPLHLVATCAANLVQSIWMRRAEGKGLWGWKCAGCGHLGARDAGCGQRGQRGRELEEEEWVMLLEGSRLALHV